MRRWRIATSLVVAFLCVLLAGAGTPAQPSGPSSEEAKKDKKGGIIDDDEIIVKPKGGSLEKMGGGLEWSDKYGALKSGKNGEFRADLYETLKKLEACKTDEKDCVRAYAVRFNLCSLVLEVRGKDAGYEWDIPGTYKQKSCKKQDTCTEGGIPPEFVDGDATGKIEAKFDEKSAWEPVVAVRFNRK